MQCPDPHFKKKYHKRRVVQKPLVDSIIDSLAPGGQVCGQDIYYFPRKCTLYAFELAYIWLKNASACSLIIHIFGAGKLYTPTASN